LQDESLFSITVDIHEKDWNIDSYSLKYTAIINVTYTCPKHELNNY